MEEPKKYFVLYGGKNNNSKQRFTNEENTALKWASIYRGTVYIDNRFEAKKRLYFYLLRKKMYN